MSAVQIQMGRRAGYPRAPDRRTRLARRAGLVKASAGLTAPVPSMDDLAIVEVHAPAQLEQAFAIRLRVFVAEQGVPERLEIDGRDETARHLLALHGDRPVGTLRVRLLEGGRVAKIERVAVLPETRGAGVGLALMRAVLALARSAGTEVARLHAQTRAERFYARLGFVAEGPEFEEDGIPHVAMRLSFPDDQVAAIIRP